MSAATGIESLVCGDIAARQRHGLEKYRTSVADSPLPLRDWLQHAYEEALDFAVYMRRAMAELDQAAPPPKPMPAPAPAPMRKGLKTVEWQGRRVSIGELADIAGTTYMAMWYRLERLSPDQAVAMGKGRSGVPPGAKKPQPVKPPPAPRVPKVKAAPPEREPKQPPRPKPAPKARRTWLFEGKQLDSSALAAIAGCAVTVMRKRLVHGDAASSVALGEAAAPGYRRRAVRPQATARLTTPVNKPVMPVVEPPAFAPDTKVIVPDDVKRTVAKTPPGRFELLAAAPAIFGKLRPGQYDLGSADTAIARALRAATKVTKGKAR